MKQTKIVTWLLSISVIVALAGGCASLKTVPTTQPVEITVSAAMGLKEALLDIQQDYEAKYPDVKIVYNFAGSGTLQTQIEQGASVDIFLSAAEKQLDELQKKNLINPATRKNLVGNQMVIVVPKDSNLGLVSFQDLAKNDVKKIGLGATETVPAGEYGMEVLKFLGIWDEVRDKSVRGKDVQTLLAYAEMGNVDVSIVFSTVAVTSDKVKIVALAPPGSHRPIIFPGAVLAGAKQPKAAEKFLNYLTGPEGSKVFVKYGFNPLGAKQ